MAIVVLFDQVMRWLHVVDTSRGTKLPNSPVARSPCVALVPAARRRRDTRAPDRSHLVLRARAHRRRDCRHPQFQVPKPKGRRRSAGGVPRTHGPHRDRPSRHATDAREPQGDSRSAVQLRRVWLPRRPWGDRHALREASRVLLRRLAGTRVTEGAVGAAPSCAWLRTLGQSCRGADRSWPSAGVRDDLLTPNPRARRRPSTGWSHLSTSVHTG